MPTCQHMARAWRSHGNSLPFDSHTRAMARQGHAVACKVVAIITPRGGDMVESTLPVYGNGMAIIWHGQCYIARPLSWHGEKSNTQCKLRGTRMAQCCHDVAMPSRWYGKRAPTHGKCMTIAWQRAWQSHGTSLTRGCHAHAMAWQARANACIALALHCVAMHVTNYHDIGTT